MNKEVERLLHLMKSYASDNDAQGYLTNSQVKLLLDYINQLETNIDEALKTTKELYEEGVEWHWDNGSLEMYVLDLLSILERGKE